MASNPVWVLIHYLTTSHCIPWSALLPFPPRIKYSTIFCSVFLRSFNSDLSLYKCSHAPLSPKWSALFPCLLKRNERTGQIHREKAAWGHSPRNSSFACEMHCFALLSISWGKLYQLGKANCCKKHPLNVSGLTSRRLISPSPPSPLWTVQGD